MVLISIFKYILYGLKCDCEILKTDVALHAAGVYFDQHFSVHVHHRAPPPTSQIPI